MISERAQDADQRPSQRQTAQVNQDFFSIGELAQRWRCSRGTVYNRLRATGAKVLDFATSGKRGRKVVPSAVVIQLETRNMKRLC